MAWGRGLFWVLGFSSVGALVASGICYRHSSQAPELALVVNPPAYRFQPMCLDQSAEVTFAIKNVSGQTRRLLGAWFG